MKYTHKMKINPNFRFLVFATMVIIEIHGLNYSDLKATGAACPRYDSCETSNQDEAIKRNCECDARCVIYNDCCIDAKRGSVEIGLNSSTFTCMPHDIASSHASYVISTCQQSWQGSNEVKHKCELLNDLSDPLMTTPATDKQRNLTYRNHYCAECNSAVLDKLSSWDIYIFCYTSEGEEVAFTPEDLVYSAQLNEWGITKDNVYHTCKISFVQSLFLLSNVRECKANLIGTCPKRWRGRNIKRMCEAYTAIVRERGGSFRKPNRLFRNPHCALCNGVSSDRMECTGIYISQMGGDSFGNLFDVNQSDGDIVGVTIPKKPSCPAGQRYDPFITKGCRSVTCLPGQTLENGECV